MINSVNLYNFQPYKKADNNGNKPIQPQTTVPFGRGQSQGILGSIKDTFLTITDGALGVVGLNAALWWVQGFVNGKLLVGKINKHFTDKITPEEKVKLPSLAQEMLEKHGLHEGAKKVNIFEGQPGQAFYTHVGDPKIELPPNSIVVGKNQHSSLFHEIGHAVEENNTSIFKKLQRGRGNYTVLALALYALLSGRKQQDDGNYSIGSSLSKSDVAIPLLAFAPELATEAKASIEGLKFLKGKIGKESSLYKNIRKSYLTCFATYLFIPLSIIIMDALRSGANKVHEKHQARQNQYYY